MDDTMSSASLRLPFAIVCTAKQPWKDSRLHPQHQYTPAPCCFAQMAQLVGTSAFQDTCRNGGVG